MCFYADYDYFPETQTVNIGPAPAPAPARCGECGRRIHAGEERYTLHTERYEACLHCDPDDRGDYNGRGGGGKCDHGEAFDYVSCLRCRDLRAAIRDVEEHEGCHGLEAEPPLEMLFEAVGDGGGWEEYVPRMLALGHATAVATLPAPDKWELAEEMVTTYPELHDEWELEDGPGPDWDHGGEGG